MKHKETFKRIKLTKGFYALVDSDDFERLNKFRWCVGKTSFHYYAMRRDGRKTMFMHRFITNAPNGYLVDHKNKNSLDNRKENLRICTAQQNRRNNSLSKLSTSGYKGVSWNKRIGKWSAYIRANYKKIHLGYFEDKIEAAHAYNNAAKEHFGEFNSPNII